MRESLSVFELEVFGTSIRGEIRDGVPGAPDVVMVHGAAAHHHWWDWMLGEVGDRWNAVALDLSGHGESGWREQYSGRTWADEVAAVIDGCTRTGRATVVGHSMGALVSIATAATYPELVERLVLVDIPIRRPGDDQDRPRGRSLGPARIHQDRSTALESFRLLPEGSTASRKTLRDLAEWSYGPVPGGWRVRFDPSLFGQFTDSLIDEWLGRVIAPVTMIGGALSPAITGDAIDYVASRVAGGVTWGMVEGAHHHVQVDRPDALAKVLMDTVAADRNSVAVPGLRSVG
ncbi:alpha/beta fold hydrolase [Microbacterium sp. NPDC055357]